MERSKSTGGEEGTGYYSQLWKIASPAQMVRWFEIQLAETPIYKIFRRAEIKRSIKYWKGQANGTPK